MPIQFRAGNGGHSGTLRAAERRFAAIEPTGIQESDELYLVSDTDANVKVRFDLMDVKILSRRMRTDSSNGARS